jgi:CxxC motif-containing protein (DUF1111 family)
MIRLGIAVLVLAGLSSAVLAAMTPEQRAAILAATTDFSAPERWETLSGGSATNRATLNRNAFSQPSANLSFEERADFFVGNGLFRRAWVSAPASTRGGDGLGPLYNARACQRCHLKDGRGHPPAGPGDSAVSMFLRLSVPAESAEDRELLAAHRANVIPEPTYGGQLQDLAVPGHAPEGRMVIDYEEVPVELADGQIAHLRRPSYRIADLGYGLLHAAAMHSPRAAPPMIGLGLLEAVAEEDIRALADPGDADGDGISGRPNLVWSTSARRSCSAASGGRRASRRSISRAATRWPATSACRIRFFRRRGAIARQPKAHAARRRTATARSTTGSKCPAR